MGEEFFYQKVTFARDPVLVQVIGLGVDFDLFLSQQEQEQEEQDLVFSVKLQL